MARAPDKWDVESLGASINIAGDEFEPLPAPEGSRMIVMADGGLYETRRTPQRWSPRVKRFSRDTKKPLSGEFFLLRKGAAEDRPPSCPLNR